MTFLSPLGFSGKDLRVLLLFTVLTFVGLADSQIISPILPELAMDFDRHVTEANRVVTFYFAGAALASLIAGPLLDSQGRKSTLLVGAFIAAIAEGAIPVTHSFVLLLVCRFFVGLGVSLAAVATTTYMGDYFPYDVRGKAIAFVTIGFFGGYAFGIPLAGFLADTFGWRAAILVFAVIMAVVSLACFPGVPRLGGPRTPLHFRAFAETVIILHRSPQPALGMLVYACIGASSIAFMAYVGDWLYHTLGFSIADRSQIFFWCGLATLMVTPLSGLWADRYGKRVPAIVGSLILAGFLLVVPLLPGNPLLIYPTFMILAAGMGLRQSPLLALVTEIITSEKRGTFIAIKNAWTQAGAALGNFIAGVLYYRGGYTAVLCFSSALIFFTAVMVFRYIREPENFREQPADMEESRAK